LRHINQAATADLMQGSLERVYRKKEHLTRDVGGHASTTEFADAIIAELESSAMPHDARPVPSSARV